MNKTRLHWSRDLNCCKDRKTSLTAFIVTSCFIGCLVPFVFYSSFVFFGWRRQQHEFLMDSGIFPQQLLRSYLLLYFHLEFQTANDQPSVSNQPSTSDQPSASHQSSLPAQENISIASCNLLDVEDIQSTAPPRPLSFDHFLHEDITT